MTDDDIQYLRILIENGILSSPVLELGAGYGAKTARALIEAADLEYRSTDIDGQVPVDFVADFEAEDIFEFFDPDRLFGSVLVFNVLEHVFDPFKVLANALRLVRPGGCLVTVTPCMWPIHNFPFDYQRILPSWYDEFARRSGCTLRREFFVFIGRGAVDGFRGSEGDYDLPRAGRNAFHSMFSRLIHKVFNTYGRGMWAAGWLAIGAVFVKEPQDLDRGTHSGSPAA